MILIHLLTQTLGIFLFSSCLQKVQLYWCSSSFSFPFLLFNTCKAFTYSQSAFNIKIKTTIYCFWSHSAALSPAAVVLFCFMSKLFKSFFILNQPLSYNHLCDWSDVADVAMICLHWILGTATEDSQFSWKLVCFLTLFFYFMFSVE